MRRPDPRGGAPHERRVEAIFKLWSPSYDYWILQPLFYRRVHAAVMRALAATGVTPARALDLGCGTARLTEDLARRFPNAQVTGMDISDGMLRVARRRLAARAALVRANAYAQPFASASFDLVTSSIAYHWLLEPERALAEIRRMLGPGGYFVLATLATMFGSTRFLGIRRVPAKQHIADLEAAGFSVLDSVYVFPRVRVFTAT